MINSLSKENGTEHVRNKKLNANTMVSCRGFGMHRLGLGLSIYGLTAPEIYSLPLQRNCV
jgi:hypothetical protein